MGLHGLDGDVELAAALLVGVSAGDEAHDLPLPGREAVQLGVGYRHLPHACAEGVQDEPGQAWGEGGVPGGHAAHGLGEVPGGDGLGDVAAGAGADDGDHVLGGVGDAQGQEAGGRDVPAGGDHLGTAPAVAPGKVDVEEDHVRAQRVDGRHGSLDVAGLGHDGEVRGVGGELAAHPGADQGVVVHDEDAQAGTGGGGGVRGGGAGGGHGGALLVGRVGAVDEDGVGRGPARGWRAGLPRPGTTARRPAPRGARAYRVLVLRARRALRPAHGCAPPCPGPGGGRWRRRRAARYGR